MFGKVRLAQNLLVCLRMVPGVLLEPPRPLKATWKLLKTKKQIDVFWGLWGLLARYWIYIQRHQGCAMAMDGGPLGGWFLVVPCLSG